MHLISSNGLDVDDGASAVDLDLPPGDILFLSSADSDLAALAVAAARRDAGTPSLRLANLMRLGHPMSVDLLVDKTASRARLVVVRVLGGVGYWSYGLEALRTLARAGGPALAVLPGEAQWNDELEAFSTVDHEQCRTIWRYLVEGGSENAINCIKFLEYLAESNNELPNPPAALTSAGIYRGADKTAAGLEGSEDFMAAPAVAAIVFYRSLLHTGSTEPIDRLSQELAVEGITALPVFVTSLKDRNSAEFLGQLFDRVPPSIVLNTTAFAVSKTDQPHAGTVLDAPGCPVLQVVLAGSSRQAWLESARGLSPRDLTMNVVLPEVDGRLLTRAVSFKEEIDAPGGGGPLTVYRSDPDRARFVARQAAAIIALAAKPSAEKKIAIVLSNYPVRDGRIANGVGLDTPASAIRVVQAMVEAGYDISGFPASGQALMDQLLAGRTNASRTRSDVRYPVGEYRAFFETLPVEVRDAVTRRWGNPEDDHFFRDRAFDLAAHRFGNLIVGLQPPRGYGVDPDRSYHDPDLIPPHGYLAFYGWLRENFATDAVLHLGKHGNMEWLPGKATGLSERCWPEVALGPTPLIYPFIVNDPGEGSQAKRRNTAVIIDHLMPAMTRAEIHGGLAHLETLVDEFYLADGVDKRRRDYLADQIVMVAQDQGLDRDLNLTHDDRGGSLQAIDAHLCDLKEMQIRDGLHTLGSSPADGMRTDTLVAMARVPRSGATPKAASLHRAIADDLGLGFDPLDCGPAETWAGPRPDILTVLDGAPWRTAGDTIERIEALAVEFVGGRPPPAEFPRTAAVLAWIEVELAPALDRSGEAEIRHLLRALGGRFVPPGPSGAPTRGRADVLPTGRNFYSVDVRGVPTEAAWVLGRASADALALRYFQDEGEWPRSIALSAWATSNMRTGGDDVAHVLALMGAMPTWESGTGRVTGFSILPLSELGRPRVDVTLRISGMFRDAFPGQIDLIDSAIRAIADLDEDDDANPLAAARRSSAALSGGADANDGGSMLAAARIFGAKPGSYGAGLQALIDHGGWESRADFAKAFLAWGGYAYGAGRAGEKASEHLANRLARADAVFQAQDNREHDILDSDDYYQFQGGLAATVETLAGKAPLVYHGDTSRPETPVIRSLGQEIARVVRGRAANPKWIAGIMRHGYKGAFEMAATVDYLFAFAATTDAVGDQHFDQLYDAYIDNDEVRGFLVEHNRPALSEMAARLREAIDRDLWAPRSNSAYDRLSAIIGQDRIAEP